MVNGCKQQDVRGNNRRRDIQRGGVYPPPTAEDRDTQINKPSTQGAADPFRILNTYFLFDTVTSHCFQPRQKEAPRYAVKRHEGCQQVKVSQRDHAEVYEPLVIGGPLS